MCGIIGGIWQNGQISDNDLSNALDLMRHRGPDNLTSQIHFIDDKTVGLGHARLAIIDLTTAATQPFNSSCGRFSLIFNGEIYNYKELKVELQAEGIEFKTNSDTEVLLQAIIFWGKAVFPRLLGMFAFAFFDKKLGKIELVRDAFGIKPLFYSSTKNKFIFSSELKPLLNLRKEKIEPDLQRAYDYLVHGDYDSNANSFVSGVKHLPPGHHIELDVRFIEEASVKRWWEPDLSKHSDLSFDDAKKKLRELFLASVNYHLRSDVPLGVALSGGIDSSSVACAVRYLNQDVPIHTFSYVADDVNLSEEAWIDGINLNAKAIENKVFANQQEMLNDLSQMIYMQGEPFGSTSIYAQYRVFKLAKEHGIKVTLDGQGADELLAGYSGYPGHRLLSIIESNGLIAAHRYATRWARFPGRNYVMAWKSLGYVMLPNSWYVFLREKMGFAFKPSWLNIRYLAEHGVNFTEKRALLHKCNKGMRVKEALVNSLTGRGLPSLLRHGDRNSMAFSIESRVPFLTIPLAEFLLSLPEHYLISDEGVTKHIFREAMRGIVPDSHLDRKDKIGFATPEFTWLKDMATEIRLSVEKASNIPFLDKEELLSELDEVMKGKQSFDGRVWRWVNYILWYSSVVD